MAVSIHSAGSTQSLLASLNAANASASSSVTRDSDFAKMLSQREAESGSRPPEKTAERPTPQAAKAPAAETPKAPAANADKPREKSVEERRLATAANKPSSSATPTRSQAEATGSAARAASTEAPKSADKAEASGEEKTDEAADATVAEGQPSTWAAAPALPRQAAALGLGAQADPGVEASIGNGASAQARDRLDAGQERAHVAEQNQLLSGESARMAAGHPGAAWQGEMARALEATVPDAARPAAGAIPTVDGAASLSGLNAAARAAEPASTPAAAAPVVVEVPTPANSPEFPQALGVQLSVLARDGVQQAELHLNPADMGPISVQIDLQGNQAQVDFGADSAATRRIIESGLPELAAALQSAGFTLSGGGVHQQARQNGSREGGNGSSSSGGRGGREAGGIEAADDRPLAAHVQARISAGGVDLYA